MTATAFDQIQEALFGFAECKDTLDGARVQTHCLYPSFDPVSVYVIKNGDGYHIHDDAGAFSEAFLHGRDEGIILRALNSEASRFQVRVDRRVVCVDIKSKEWLASAILTVANAAAAAAYTVISKHAISHEKALVDRIYDLLSEKVAEYRIVKEFEARGKSGGVRRFDFAVFSGRDEELVINGVAPHHSSISSKYVSFADVDLDQGRKFAVFDRKLETDDVSLLQQVASIVPLDALPVGTRRALAH